MKTIRPQKTPKENGEGKIEKDPGNENGHEYKQ